MIKKIIYVFLILLVSIVDSSVISPLYFPREGRPREIYRDLREIETTRARSFIPQSIQDELAIIDELIEQEEYQQVNNIILNWLEENTEELNFTIGLEFFNRFDITLDEDPVMASYRVGMIESSLTTEQLEELEPIITNIRARYSISLIDQLIGEGNNKEANVKILQWLFYNVSLIDYAYGSNFLSRFDLLSEEDPVFSMRRLSLLYDFLNDEQKFSLHPIMVQIRTKYNLIKGESDPEILEDITPLQIDILKLQLTNIETLDLQSLDLLLTNIETLDLQSLDLLLTNINDIDGNIIDKLYLLLISHGVMNAYEIISNIRTYGGLSKVNSLVVQSQISVWKGVHDRINVAKQNFDFYTRRMAIDPDLVEKWSDVSQNITEPVYVPLNIDGVRIIGEVKTPEDQDELENQLEEIEFFIEQGYNGFLFVSEGEAPGYLKDLMLYLNDRGFVVGYAIGFQEGGVVPNIYKDLDVIEYIHSKLAPVADFSLLKWRLTSLPHFGEFNMLRTMYRESKDATDEAKAYAKVMAHLARIHNPDIPLLDEVFYDSSRLSSIGHNFEWSSGTVVLGMGKQFQSTRGLIEHNYEGIHVPLVIGANYYWKSRPRLSAGMDLNKESIFNNRLRIEKDSLLSDQIPMTLTIVGDLMGERRGNTDSLTRSKWRYKGE